MLSFLIRSSCYLAQQVCATDMTGALFIKNKLNFIKGSLLAWITKGLDPSIANHYLYVIKALELWAQLKARHAMGSGLSKYQLNKNIATYAKEMNLVILCLVQKVQLAE